MLPVIFSCLSPRMARLAVIAVVMVACGGDDNVPPQAAFVDPQGTHDGPYRVFAEESVALDGSASSDPDGDRLTFRWRVLTRPIGGAPVLEDPTAALATFSPGWQGRYVVMLTVDDGARSTEALREVVVGPSFATWSLEPANQVALLDAGPALCTTQGSEVLIAGRRLTGLALVDAHWTLVPPGGSIATLQDAGTDSPRLLTDIAGRYVVQWHTSVLHPQAAAYVFGSGTTVDAVPPRSLGSAYSSPSGMQVSLREVRRLSRSDGFVRIEVDLGLLNQSGATLTDAPLHLMTADGTEVLPLDEGRVEVAPGDAGMTLRTHVFLVPAAWTPLLWEYEPLSTRPPPPPDTPQPPPERLLWCAAA